MWKIQLYAELKTMIYMFIQPKGKSTERTHEKKVQWACAAREVGKTQIEWKMRMTRKQYWKLSLHISPALSIVSMYLLDTHHHPPACHLQARAAHTHTHNFHLPPKSIPLWWFITTTAPCSRRIFSMPRTSNETPSNLSSHRHPKAGNLRNTKEKKRR